MPTLLVLDIGLGATGRQLHNLRGEQTETRLRCAQPPYRDAPWGQAFWAESEVAWSLEWRPYTVWRDGDMAGQFMNVCDGVRRGHCPAATDAQRLPVVFVFGGSTAWGLGARDAETIPSWLSRLAEARGEPWWVVNRGVTGWTDWQSILEFSELCARGERPDVAVFYLGVNDLLANASQGGRRPVMDQRAYVQALERASRERGEPIPAALDAYRRQSGVARLLGLREPPGEPPPEASTRELVRRIVSTLDENRRFVERVAAAYGVRPVFVWQPCVATKTALAADERQLLEVPGVPSPLAGTDAWWWVMSCRMQELYKGVAEALLTRPGYVDARRAMDSLGAEQGYIDWMHATEAGNRAVAGFLLDRVRAAVQSKTP